MRLIQRLALLAYAAAAVLGVGSLALAWADISIPVFSSLLERPFAAVEGVLLCIVALNVLVSVGRALFSPRRAPRAVQVPETTIEVTVRALESSVRAAVEESGAFMVDRVEGKVPRRSPDRARFTVEVVPLIEEGIAEAAAGAQERANAACERLVGAPCANVRVVVLPAVTTTVVRKESE